MDCFAGPWGDESVSFDSASIAISLRVLARCRDALRRLGIELSFRALYIERDEKAFARLKRYLAERESDGISAEALQGDFVDLIPAVID